jgi:ABC-type multidrug transport system ATPase subunit
VRSRAAPTQDPEVRRAAADPAAAIETADLTKRYAEVTAVDSLNLIVRRGEIYGFLGRNGAGKTTTIRMLLGLVRPTRGQARVFGKDVTANRRDAVAQAGSLVETATSYPNLTVRENLEIQRSLTCSPREAVERAMRLLGLDELAGRRAGHLSLGNKQRLALARAILSRPRLLILDEPANGLDPAGIVEIRRLLRRLTNEDGVTVFVSSHILSEVSQLADRIGIIHRGRLVDEIDPRSGGLPVRLELQVSDVRKASALLASAYPAAAITQLENDRLEMVCRDSRSADVARLLVESGVEVSALCPRREDLEARFLRLTGGER